MKFLLFIAFLSMIHLSPKDNPYDQFLNWYKVNQGQLTTQIVDKDFVFDLKYIPKEERVLKALVKEESIQKSEIKKVESKYSGLIEFNFRVRHAEAQKLLEELSLDEQDYNTRLHYLIEQIGHDFTLVTSLGERKPFQCNFENNYGTAPYLMLHLSFDKEEGEQMQKLAYEDQFFGVSDLIFDLEEIENLNIPKIK